MNLCLWRYKPNKLITNLHFWERFTTQFFGIRRKKPLTEDIKRTQIVHRNFIGGIT